MPTAPLPTYADAQTSYADVQGNILKGHGRDHALLLFLSFEAGNIAPARAWLASLLPGAPAGSQAPITITNTEQQLRETRRFKQTGVAGEPFASLVLTAGGIELLGSPALAAKVKALDEAFARTMRASETQKELQDPDYRTNWDEGWWLREADGTLTSTAAPAPIHALLLLADDDLEDLQKLVKTVVLGIEAAGITIRVGEWGHALRDEHGAGIEHFGYADGVSQPVYLREDMPNHPPRPTGAKEDPLQEGVNKWNPAAPAEELVLVPDPLYETGKSFGSFFVFRKLEQNVPDFKKAEEALADELTLLGDDAERAGAMVVGRFEDGTPVTKRHSAGLNKPIRNNFNYSDDGDGLKCPYHAHIRKVNPRTMPEFGTSPDPDNPSERQRQITRRGIPYGTQKEALVAGSKVGLLFMCFQKSIKNQFEYMQGTLASHPDVPHAGVGVDPLIGPADEVGPPVFIRRTPQAYPLVWGESETKAQPFAAFVTLRGGEYFYAPSLPGLQALAGMPA